MPELRQADVKPALIRRLRHVVVKIGSSVLADGAGLDRAALARLASDIAGVHARGLAVTVVSSGAIAAGRTLFGGAAPRTIPERQAAASVGQIQLMAEWQKALAAHGIVVAQILLDADDLAKRHRYLNAEHALATLHAKRVVPIVNENDTVSVDEIKFGDNDNLSALVGTLVGADLLVMLSDVGGLFTANPVTTPDARRIPVLERVDQATLELARGSSGLGTGGMRSKLLAARKASAAGIAVVIGDGRKPGTLAAVLDPQADVGTLVLPLADRLARRKHWIAYTVKPKGVLHCDAGAVAAVTTRGRSLLPSGVVSVSGRFEPGDCVSLVGPDGEEFARGLVSYRSTEAARIAGKRSSEVEALLGYKMGDAIVHRDDLVVLADVERPRVASGERAS
ncbi:MAG TPA: glutamate 5-kinase [Candidatus Binatia bacterium]